MEAILKRQRKSESNLKRPTQEQLTDAHARNAPVTLSVGSNSFDLQNPGRVLAPPLDQRKRTFSLLRLRNASDPNLGHKTREQRQKNPPLPTSVPPPSIITTSPTYDPISDRNPSPYKSKEQLGVAANSPASESGASSSRSSFSSRRLRDGFSRNNSSMRMSRVTFDEPERSPMPSQSSSSGPPPYDDHTSSLPIPPPRFSESSRSTASSGEQIACTTTTTHTVSTITTFWKISRRKKNPEPLFPLPDKVERVTPRASHEVPDPDLTPVARPFSMMLSRSTPGTPSNSSGPSQSQNASAMLAASALGFTGPATTLFRSNSAASMHSVKSSPAPEGPSKVGLSRGRSMTLSAVDNGATTGRNSFSSIFNLRLRRDSEPVSNGTISRTSSPQPYNSSTMPSSNVASKERLIIPERHVEDTPQMYLSRLKQAVSKSVLASLLAKSDDSFHVAVLKAYMNIFIFSGDPMDMALRKLLMEAELPRETQQIDRVIQAFADRYHECNPQIYTSSEQAYFIAFSLLILHTDVFNKNNRRKMQKQDYVKNTQGEGITNDILECFYQNITYTPFIHVEDDLDINGEKIVPQKPKRSLFSRTNSDGKRPVNLKEPIDPYTLILENRLELLRPSLKDIIEIEDPYNYLGTAQRLDIPDLHRSFFRYAVLQIVSLRSRPDAFLSPSTVANPQDADPGVVDLKVTKVGTLWRKDTKKKKMRDPWQEWGALLTGSKLYFFRNVGWIKNLISQYEQHQSAGNFGTPVVFTPPLHTFKPDAEVSTDDAVALLDSSYKKHKHAFAFVRHGGMQEYFLAESEADMNDWLAKLNFAATFRTAGVRMRGVVGGHYEGQRSRGIRRMDNSTSAQIVDSPSGEVSILRGSIDQQLATEILNARRQVIEHKITEFNEQLAKSNKQLDAYLRNAKHLSILAPIQQKAREQVVLAASSLAAKLKWIRLEIWKFKCHRDILLLDIEDEKKTLKEQARRSLAFSASRRPSKASTHSSRKSNSPSQSPQMSNASTPTQAHFTFPTHNDAPRNSSETWEIPPLAFDKSPRNSLSSVVRRSLSVSSLAATKSDTTANNPDAQSSETTLSIRSGSPARSEDDLSADPEKELEKEKEKEKNKDGTKTKRRLGLQKTLREASVHGHRNKKSRDVSNEIGSAGPEKKNAEGEILARSTGSFTVHGKKASVITFGSEWNSMSPEERLKLHKPTSPTVDGNGKALTLVDSSSATITTRRGSQITLDNRLAEKHRPRELGPPEEAENQPI